MLDTPRWRLLDQAATEAGTEAPFEVIGTHWDASKRYECLKNARALADTGKAAEMLVRDPITRGAVKRGMDPRSLECSRCGHFELIGTNFLKDTLEGVISTEEHSLRRA